MYHKLYIAARLGDGTYYLINEYLENIMDYGIKDSSLTEEHLKLTDKLFVIELSEKIIDNNLQILKQLLESNNNVIVVDQYSNIPDNYKESIKARCLIYTRGGLIDALKNWFK